MKCPKHPNYKGVLRPRCACRPCWDIYHTASYTRLYAAQEEVSKCWKEIMKAGDMLHDLATAE